MKAPESKHIGTKAQWTALQREAALAADHMAGGVMALGRANYTTPGQYHVAFFALSIGLERGCKLALVLDALIETGNYPTEDAFRRFGHKLRDLLNALDAIAIRRGYAEKARLPRQPVHEAIIDIFAQFASNVTRYYNLDFLTGVARGSDPVSRWYTEVVLAEFASSVSESKKAKIDEIARIVAAMIGSSADVWHTGEGGEQIDSVLEASRRTGIYTATQPFVRLRVLQIHRFLGNVVSALGTTAQEHQHVVPFMSEMFGRFDRDDRALMRRKTM